MTWHASDGMPRHEEGGTLQNSFFSRLWVTMMEYTIFSISWFGIWHENHGFSREPCGKSKIGSTDLSILMCCVELCNSFLHMCRHGRGKTKPMIGTQMVTSTLQQKANKQKPNSKWRPLRCNKKQTNKNRTANTHPCQLNKQQMRTHTHTHKYGRVPCTANKSECLDKKPTPGCILKRFCSS